MKSLIILFLTLSIQLVSFAQPARTIVGEISVIQVPNPTFVGTSSFVTTAGTAEVLAASTACKVIRMKAFLNNTGDIYVGSSDVDKMQETVSL